MPRKFDSTSSLGQRWPGRIRVALLALSLASAAAAAAAQNAAPPAGSVDANAMFLDGMHAYDLARYPEAVVSFGQVIDLLDGADPQQRDLLAKAYEYRGRARYVTRDTAGTESDFGRLLQLRPDYEPAADISPRVRATFVEVRKRMVGDLTVRLSPAGEVTIDGNAYAVGDEPLTTALLAGEHRLVAKRRGYGTFEQTVVVPPGEMTPILIALERITATFIVRTIPDGVEVLFDGVPKGITAKAPDAGDVSAPLIIQDLGTGTYVTRFQRECYKPLERSLVVPRFEDLEATDPIRLEPAVARLTLQIAEPDATIYLDGVARGANPADVADICEGDHVIDVRSPRGRFIDKRYWRAGAVETIAATLRPGFAVVVNVPPPGRSATEFAGQVEAGVGDAKGALIFTPAEAELGPAQAQEELSADFFRGTSAAAAQKRRDAGERIAAKLNAQGIAAIQATGPGEAVQLSLLAAGSTAPDVLTFDLSDPVSRAGAVAALAGEVPPILRVTIEPLTIDVLSISGAVVVRAPDGSGLGPGDVIVGVAGTPVRSVAELTAALAGRHTRGVPLSVQPITGAVRTVTVIPRLVPDTIPLADPHLLYNVLLLRLEDTVRQAKTPIDTTAARLNLAIVEMRLGRVKEAVDHLEQLRLTDGPGVSSGTVAYLLGLCYESLGRRADATRAFTAAVKSPDSLLSLQGPQTAALAEAKLQAAGAPR